MTDSVASSQPTPHAREFFNSVDESAAVEIGCGTGQWLLEARRRFEAEILGKDREWNAGLVVADFNHRCVDMEQDLAIGNRFDLANYTDQRSRWR